MKPDEQWRGYMLWCKYFHGVQHEACDKGIKYIDVRQSEPPGLPAEFPCLTANGTKIKCPLAEFPSEVEAMAQEAEIQAVIKGFFDDLKKGVCPRCQKPIERKQQVGQCVYAQPCGHRLYQGKVADDSETT